jgi:hypothetical protein
MDIIKELVLLADRLDQKGLNKEADFLDSVVNKFAAKKKEKDMKSKKTKDEKEESGAKDKGTSGKKTVKTQKKDQDGDSDSDFRDVMMARMKASGMSKEDAEKKTKKYNS